MEPSVEDIKTEPMSGSYVSSDTLYLCEGSVGHAKRQIKNFPNKVISGASCKIQYKNNKFLAKA